MKFISDKNYEYNDELKFDLLGMLYGHISNIWNDYITIHEDILREKFNDIENFAKSLGREVKLTKDKVDIRINITETHEGESINDYITLFVYGEVFLKDEDIVLFPIQMRLEIAPPILPEGDMDMLINGSGVFSSHPYKYKKGETMDNTIQS